MGLFQGRKHFTGTVARKRLSILLTAERLDCAPRNMQMMKNDLTMALGRYLSVEEDRISIRIDYSPAVMTIRIPLHNSEDKHVKII